MIAAGFGKLIVLWCGAGSWAGTEPIMWNAHSRALIRTSPVRASYRRDLFFFCEYFEPDNFLDIFFVFFPPCDVAWMYLYSICFTQVSRRGKARSTNLWHHHPYFSSTAVGQAINMVVRYVYGACLNYRATSRQCKPLPLRC